MANITTFATLKSELLAMIGRAPADPVYQMVTRDINRDLRLVEMESTSTIAEAAEMTLPADFLEMIAVYRDVTARTILTPISVPVLHSTYETSGTPIEYAIVKGKLKLDKPGSGENIVIRYYAALSLLSADEDTNSVLTTYPGVYLYGSLFHHATILRDAQNAAMWGQQYQAEKAMAQGATDAQRASGGTMVPRPPKATTP